MTNAPGQPCVSHANVTGSLAVAFALLVPSVIALFDTPNASAQTAHATRAPTDTDSKRPTATIRGRLTDPAGQPLTDRTLSLVAKQARGPRSVLKTTTTDTNGCFTFEAVPCKSLRIQILQGTDGAAAECTAFDVPVPGAYDIKLTLAKPQAGQPSLEHTLLARPPRKPRKPRIPLIREKPFELGPGWDLRGLAEALAKNLADLARQHLPGCEIRIPSDRELGRYDQASVISIHYHTRKQSVLRLKSKARGSDSERRTEVGPEPDGLILWVWLCARVDQVARPVTVKRDPWLLHLGEVRISEPKTYVKVNLSFGSKADRQFLEVFGDPVRWLAALKARQHSE